MDYQPRPQPKKYMVRFYHYTDNRTEIEVNAYNEVSALAEAMKIVSGYWLFDKGFRIEMELSA